MSIVGQPWGIEPVSWGIEGFSWGIEPEIPPSSPAPHYENRKAWGVGRGAMIFRFCIRNLWHVAKTALGGGWLRRLLNGGDGDSSGSQIASLHACGFTSWRASAAPIPGSIAHVVPLTRARVLYSPLTGQRVQR